MLFNILILLSLSFLFVNGYMISSIVSINQLRTIKVNSIKLRMNTNEYNNSFKLRMNTNEDNNNDNNNDINNSNGRIKAEGYLGSDLSTLDNDKQSRVLLYIGIALLPCLFLIPFVMSRDFVPPTDDVSPFGF